MDPNDPRLDTIALRISGLDERGWQRQKEAIRLLQNPALRSLALSLDIDVDGLVTQQQDLRRSLTAVLQGAIYFGPLGWTIMANQISSESLIDAVRIWEETREESAVDERLTRAWDRLALRRSFGSVTTLAGKHEGTLDRLLERDRLLGKALDHHDRGEYEASTMIVLAQVDGLTLDFTEGKYGFFYHAEDRFFEDDSTLAGMPDFLRTVRHAVSESDNVPSASTGFRRHPIMHGRYVAFGTQANSTKAFALLSGLLEWLKPKAAVLTEKWPAEHEGRDAGSDEVHA